LTKYVYYFVKLHRDLLGQTMNCRRAHECSPYWVTMKVDRVVGAFVCGWVEAYVNRCGEGT
jgi:hypothetical protein